MIEITKRNKYWEAYIDGGLYHYDEDLQNLLQYLARRSEEIITEINDFQG